MRSVFSPRWRAASRLAVALVALGTLVSCSSSAPYPHQTATSATAAATTTDPASVSPGTLLSSRRLDTVDVRIGRAGANATKITYRSTSGIDGSATEVTGAAFIPRSAPPEGGWPVIAYAHATVGILEDCAPSDRADLVVGAAPQIEALLRAGYVVVMPDYQGLGSKGPHPYLEPRTVGYDMIDAVRAVRQLVPSASTRWASYGASQGGQASWSAAELAPTYGEGLDMVGAVALAPMADVSALPQSAVDGTLSTAQLPVLEFIVNAVSSLEPDFSIDKYLHGFALQNNTALLQCSGAGLTNRNRLVFDLKAEDVKPVDAPAADRLTDILRRWSLPQPGGPSPVPVFVAVGTDDVMVPPEWTETAVRRACDKGESVVWLMQKGVGHDNVDYRPALEWLGARFAGAPLQNACQPGEGT